MAPSNELVAIQNKNDATIKATETANELMRLYYNVCSGKDVAKNRQLLMEQIKTIMETRLKELPNSDAKDTRDIILYTSVISIAQKLQQSGAKGFDQIVTDLEALGKDQGVVDKIKTYKEAWTVLSTHYSNYAEVISQSLVEKGKQKIMLLDEKQVETMVNLMDNVYFKRSFGSEILNFQFDSKEKAELFRTEVLGQIGGRVKFEGQTFDMREFNKNSHCVIFYGDFVKDNANEIKSGPVPKIDEEEKSAFILPKIQMPVAKYEVKTEAQVTGSTLAPPTDADLESSIGDKNVTRSDAQGISTVAPLETTTPYAYQNKADRGQIVDVTSKALYKMMSEYAKREINDTNVITFLKSNKGKEFYNQFKADVESGKYKTYAMSSIEKVGDYRNNDIQIKEVSKKRAINLEKEWNALFQSAKAGYEIITFTDKNRDLDIGIYQEIDKNKLGQMIKDTKTYSPEYISFLTKYYNDYDNFNATVIVPRRDKLLNDMKALLGEDSKEWQSLLKDKVITEAGGHYKIEKEKEFIKRTGQEFIGQKGNFRTQIDAAFGQYRKISTARPSGSGIAVEITSPVEVLKPDVKATVNFSYNYTNLGVEMKDEAQVYAKVYEKESKNEVASNMTANNDGTYSVTFTPEAGKIYVVRAYAMNNDGTTATKIVGEELEVEKKIIPPPPIIPPKLKFPVKPFTNKAEIRPVEVDIPAYFNMPDMFSISGLNKVKEFQDGLGIAYSHLGIVANKYGEYPKELPKNFKSEQLFKSIIQYKQSMAQFISSNETYIKGEFKIDVQNPSADYTTNLYNKFAELMILGGEKNINAALDMLKDDSPLKDSFSPNKGVKLKGYLSPEFADMLIKYHIGMGVGVTKIFGKKPEYIGAEKTQEDALTKIGAPADEIKQLKNGQSSTVKVDKKYYQISRIDDQYHTWDIGRTTKFLHVGFNWDGTSTISDRELTGMDIGSKKSSTNYDGPSLIGGMRIKLGKNFELTPFAGVNAMQIKSRTSGLGVYNATPTWYVTTTGDLHLAFKPNSFVSPFIQAGVSQTMAQDNPSKTTISGSGGLNFNITKTTVLSTSVRQQYDPKQDSNVLDFKKAPYTTFNIGLGQKVGPFIIELNYGQPFDPLFKQQPTNILGNPVRSLRLNVTLGI